MIIPVSFFWLIRSPVFLFCVSVRLHASCMGVTCFWCVCLYRLAEMESQNCSFFTDSLSPDESLWVCSHPHTMNPLITTTLRIMCVFCVCALFICDTLIASVFIYSMCLYMYVGLLGKDWVISKIIATEWKWPTASSVHAAPFHHAHACCD